MRLATIASVAVLAAGSARAASLPIVIEPLNAAAKACGLAEPQLESVALLTLQQSEMQPDASAGGSLNVRVTVTQSRRGRCAARISVAMKAFAKPRPSDGVAKSRQPSRLPVVVLCSKAGDYSASRNTFPLQVESAIEHWIRRCVGSLRY
jgi:hypothetical protein